MILRFIEDLGITVASTMVFEDTDSNEKEAATSTQAFMRCFLANTTF
jgi:hypothetical protein